MVHSVTMWCSVVQYIAACCSMLRYGARCCSEDEQQEGAVYAHSKKALYTLKRALYTLKRALYTFKRALYTLKRALYTLKRALYTLQRVAVRTSSRGGRSIMAATDSIHGCNRLYIWLQQTLYIATTDSMYGYN